MNAVISLLLRSRKLWWYLLRPVYSDTTQLDVELSCVGEVSTATPMQLNSTQMTCFALIGCTLQLGQLHCRSSATVELRRWGCLWRSNSSQVELSCVAINGLLLTSRRHNDVILLPAIRRVSGNDFVFQQDSAPAHCAAHVQQLNCCAKKRRTFLCPTCGLQTAQISVLRIMRSGMSCSVVSTTDKSVVWMNLNGGLSMSGAVLNSRLFTRLLTSGEEDIERVSMLKEGISSTACKLTMLTLSISVTFNVTCLTATYLITKSCQQPEYL